MAPPLAAARFTARPPWAPGPPTRAWATAQSLGAGAPDFTAAAHTYLFAEVFPARLVIQEGFDVCDQPITKIGSVAPDPDNGSLQVAKHTVEYATNRQIPNTLIGSSNESEEAATTIRPEANDIRAEVRFESPWFQRAIFHQPPTYLLRCVDEVAGVQIRQRYASAIAKKLTEERPRSDWCEQKKGR